MKIVHNLTPGRPARGVRALLLLAGLWASLMGTPVRAQDISNVAAAVHGFTGTAPNEIHITYDLALPTNDAVEVVLAYSADNGATFDLPPPGAILHGDSGTTVTRGTGKVIRWVNGVQQLGFESPSPVIFRVYAALAPGNKTIQFLEKSTSVMEGEGRVLVPIKVTPYFKGRISCSVSSMSTGRHGIDYNLASGLMADGTLVTVGADGTTATLDVDGTQATIAVDLVDDKVISQDEDGVPALRTVILQLSPTETARGPVELTGKFTHTLIISDNDGYWRGIVARDALQLGFRMKIVRDGSGADAWILRERGSMFAPDPAVSTQAQYQLSGVTLDSSVFKGHVENIPTRGSFLGKSPDSRINHSLSFDGVTDVGTTTSVLRGRIAAGSVQDAQTVAGASHLNRTTSSTFVLIADIERRSKVEAPSTPASQASAQAAIRAGTVWVSAAPVVVPRSLAAAVSADSLQEGAR